MGKKLIDIYSEGLTAGHELFHRHELLAECPNPYPEDTAEHAKWDDGYEQGQDDAYNSYYA